SKFNDHAGFRAVELGDVGRAFSHGPQHISPLHVGSIGSSTGFFKRNLRVDGKWWFAVNDAGIAIIHIRMNHGGFTRYYVEDAAAIIAVEILPRRSDLEQSIVIIGDGIALGSGH